MIIAAFLIASVLAVALAASCADDGGRNRSVEWHSLHGHWRVKYPDGQLSQHFTRAVAEDYREIFGGTVIKA